MRLALDPRARRILRRIPRIKIYSGLELLLYALLAIQIARLVWTLVTPLGPIGAWKTDAALRPPAATSTLGQFDPFFRQAGGSGPVVVTQLAIQLFGVREDRATGRGAAIVGTPDGQQRSVQVGEEVMPGVILTAVGFDNITISRSGTAEQLFLDQSGAAPPPSAGTPGSTPAPPPPPPVAPGPSLFPPSMPVATPPPAANPAAGIGFMPRVTGGGVSGIVATPQGDGAAFRAAGLRPGDVIVSVGGQRVQSAQQALALGSQLGSGPVRIEVERDGRTVPLQLGPRN